MKIQERNPVHPEAHQVRASGLPLLYHVPGAGDGGSADRCGNPHHTAQVYDLNRFPDLREKYQVMSVPCLVINDGEQVSFGKKNIRQLLELLA